jgi:hypothetical protein
MPAAYVRCPVLGAQVTTITDFEGKFTTIICSEYDRRTRSCRRKKDALTGGPLSQLLERVEENTLGSRGTRCDLSWEP